MSNPSFPEDHQPPASREEIMSAMFAHMVIQQTNMALMLLGKVPHPETGEIIQDVESAKMFIDQLEMLEAKTKGNLDKREEGLLKQSLMALHLAFVGVIEAPTGGAAATPAALEPIPPTAHPAPVHLAPAAPAPPPVTNNEAESQKKFSKKY